MNTAMDDWKEIGALRARVAEMDAKVDEAQKAEVTLSLKLGAADAEFKNFHRLLCERFGATHDPVDWRRDQLSLIEHIAGLSLEPHADAIDTSPKPVDKSAKDRHVERLEAENAALRHDLSRSMTSHVADINGPTLETQPEFDLAWVCGVCGKRHGPEGCPMEPHADAIDTSAKPVDESEKDRHIREVHSKSEYKRLTALGVECVVKSASETKTDG